jgi:riboflavin kinase/FMN adenylyltransferase
VILQSVKDDAQAAGLKSMVITFEPHPRKQLFGGEKIKRLTPFAEKERLFKNFGLDTMVCIPFTEEFSRYKPEQFVQQVLVESLGVSSVGVGFNFRFGINGSGDAMVLQKLTEEYGIGSRVFPAVEINGKLVSSTLIRETLQVGDVEDAARYLGYPYRLQGTVVHGDQRGRTLGYPTANLRVDGDIMAPALGVYGVWVYHNARRFAGMANLGLRPTFAGSTASEVRLEVYILDFDEDIYGDLLTVEFMVRVRREKMFAGAGKLKEQLKTDQDFIRSRLLGAQP